MISCLLYQNVSTTDLLKFIPETDAIPALLTSALVKLRLSRMMGINGGAAKVDTKHVKNEIHERWKARMWGWPQVHKGSVVALCSESTGTANPQTTSASANSTPTSTGASTLSLDLIQPMNLIFPCDKICAGSILNRKIRNSSRLWHIQSVAWNVTLWICSSPTASSLYRFRKLHELRV